MILITGGAGYVGSHTSKALAKAGEEIVVFDNLSTGHLWAAKWGHFFKGDLKFQEDLERCFQEYPITAVIHFGALSLVGESMKMPEEYYFNNVLGTLNLLKVMRKSGVDKIVFSSSAAVYGEPVEIPIPESHPLKPVSVYGKTKVMMEMLMEDFFCAYGIRYAALRYFNACGADPNGEIGEIHDPETHLIPNVFKVLRGEKEFLEIFGNDYPTPDGTPIRDYIHVCDLARAHLKALELLRKGENVGAVNLGSARGFSVMEIVRAVEKLFQKELPKRIAPRRPGDPAVLVASNEKAKQVLNWEPESSSLEEIVLSAFNFYESWSRSRKPE